MPKDDWKKNSIPTLFTEWNAWPWTECPKCHGQGGDETCDGLPNPASVLDVGCGLSLKSQHICTPVRVGFDLHGPYLEQARKQAPDVSWIPVLGDVTRISEFFLPNSFDLVIALDIIEHVEKDQALKLIEDLERIAKVAVILETPKGFFPQDMDILGFDAHHLQTHRCGFEVEELEALGYQVFARDHKLYPVKRHSSEPIATECQLLNAIKRVDGAK